MAAKSKKPDVERARSQAPSPYAKIDGIIRALYECISGPPGGQDWERDRELYHPRALIVRTRVEDGKGIAFPFNFEEFRVATIPMLAGRHFHEIETRRSTHRFGQIAHVMSAYEAREKPDAKDVLFRGINMIHLWEGDLGDGQGMRWWIMSIIWDNERDGVKIKKHWFD